MFKREFSFFQRCFCTVTIGHLFIPSFPFFLCVVPLIDVCLTLRGYVISEFFNVFNCYTVFTLWSTALSTLVWGLEGREALKIISVTVYEYLHIHDKTVAPSLSSWPPTGWGNIITATQLQSLTQSFWATAFSHQSGIFKMGFAVCLVISSVQRAKQTDMQRAKWP